MHILIINGPNLNLLGTREPQTYGSTTLAQINAQLTQMAEDAGKKASFFQSNDEAALIDRIHQARHEGVDAILINAGGLTHTSVALRDALAGVAIPFVEVHISNVYKRETFRHHSYLSDVAVGVVAGLGPMGYELALRYAMTHIAPLKTLPQ